MDIDQVNVAWRQVPVMTKMACGARSPRRTSDGKLIFKVHSKPQRWIEVALNGLDLYNVCYFRLKRGSLERIELESVDDLYADMLGETIYHMVNK